MAIAFVTSTTAGGTEGAGVSTFTVSFTPTNAGDLWVLEIGYTAGSGGTTSSISGDTTGTAANWVHAATFPSNTNSSGGIYDIWYYVNHPGGACTLTVTTGSAALKWAAQLAEFSGFGTLAPTQDTQNKNNGTGSSGDSTGTVNDNNAVLLVGGLVGSSGTFTISSVSENGTNHGSTSPVSLGVATLGSTNASLGGAYEITNAVASGNYGFSFTISSSRTFNSGIIALLPGVAATSQLPTMMHSRLVRHRVHVVRAKRKVYSDFALSRLASPPPPVPLRHRQQPKHTPHVKAKRVVRSSVQLRIPQAPPAIFPPELRHGRIPKRTPHVKAKRVVKSSIELRIPQAPPAIFPPELRRGQQKKRTPHLRPKRRVRNAVELTIPQAPPSTAPLLPLPVFRPKVERKKSAAKGRQRARGRLTQPPQPQSALPRERGRKKLRSLPQHKRRVVSNVELVISLPQPAKRPLPLPIFVRHRVKRRFSLGKRGWILTFYGVHVTPPPPTGQLNNPLIKSLGKMMHRIG